MKKTLIGLLLVACMVIGLLPLGALAETTTAKILVMGSEELTVTKGGTPVYLKNKEFDAANVADGTTTFKAWTQEAGTADNWNVKFEWPADGIPTVTLKDAKMDYYDNDTLTYAYINVGGTLVSTDNRTTADLNDGTSGTALNPLIAAIMPVKGYNIDLKVVLQGENKIETGSGFVFGNPSAKANAAEEAAGTYEDVYFQNMYFVGEGTNQTTACGGGIGIFTKAGYNVSFDNVFLTINTKVKGSNAIPIHVTNGNLTINGGHLNVKNPNNVAIWTQNGGDIVINGDVTVNHSLTSTAGAAGIFAKKGTLTINGGNIKGTSSNAPILNSGVDLIINGGNLSLMSAYYAIYTDNSAPIHINGGTLEIMAERSFRTAPILGPKVSGYAGASESAAEVYDISVNNIHMKPWVLLSDEPIDLDVEVTEPSTLPPLNTDPSTAPTQPNPTTVPTQAPTIAPTTLPTQAPTTVPTQGTDATTAPTGNGSTGETLAPADGATVAPSTGATTNSTKTTEAAQNSGSANTTGTNDADGESSNSALIIVAVVVVLGTGAAIAVIITKRKKG